MNRNRYRLVFNETLGMMVPVAETARRAGKSGAGKAASASALALAGVLLGTPAWAELPVPSAGGSIPNFVTAGQAAYQVNGAQAFVNQVGDKSILNWQSFNISPGHNVQFRQVDSLATNNLVQGASFTSLNRIWDMNPSVIAGSISQAAGQKANVILVNSNGIAFMGGSQVNLNTFTASTLNIADSYVLGSLLTNNSTIPQFEKALDGTDGRGFIKVMEGARISAGSFGRVMLIAPTVVNKGTVSTPDGQLIAAAGSRVFLRAAGNEDPNVRGLLVEVDSPATLNDFDTANTSVRDGVLAGQTVALTDAAEDKLGHVINRGELTSPRGNVTMIGYAVNQNGIARATTSVLANGSVYLLGKDRVVQGVSTRGGRVTLGANSVTEILPETGDATGVPDGATAGAGLERPSRVFAHAQGIDVLGGARVRAPAAEVKFLAQDNPSQGESGTSSPFALAGAAASTTAYVRIHDGASIDVSGLRDVALSAARNVVEIELRGDELKDSPVNQTGPIRSQKVYVDLDRALKHAKAGVPTLIERKALESNEKKLERTVAERSSSGGTVVVKSQGEARLDAGATVNLSGGSLKFTPATLKTTLLSTGGKLVDIADALADARYDGVANRFVIDYGRWNRKETIDLGQSYRFDPGYTEGKDAGRLDVIGMQTTTMRASVLGDTVTGTRQREAGVQPAGAQLRLGTDAVSGDYKLNQKVIFGTALPAEVNTLSLDPALFGAGRIASLDVFSNQAAEVREALRLPQGGRVNVVAKGVEVNADVSAPAGRIEFRAADNAVNTAPVALDVRVAPGVTLDVAGRWTNDTPGQPGTVAAPLAHGGSIALRATETVDVGAGSVLDADGGGWLKPDGKLASGNGGGITLDGATVRQSGELRGHGLGKGGTLTLNTAAIRIGGPADPGALNLDEGFFQRGGFAQFDLGGTLAIDIADGTLIEPRVRSFELPADATLRPGGGRLAQFASLIERDARVRQAANVAFSSNSPGDPAAGRITLGENARILADDGATLTFAARSAVTLLGEVRSAGGKVTATLKRGEGDGYDPAAAIWLGNNARIDVAGAVRTFTDTRGLTQGRVLNGGTVTLDAERGFVVTEAGSRIDVSGAAPVRLDTVNEQGGLGRTVASDAGTIRLGSTEGVLADGTLALHAGSPAQRGGTLSVALSTRSDQTGTLPVDPRTLILGPTASPQAAGLRAGDAVPPARNGNTELGADRLAATGADRLLFAAERVRLNDGLDLGAGVQPREIALATSHVETAGGNATLNAHTVRLGGSGSTPVPAPVPGTGTFTVNASLVDVAGDLTLSGMAQTQFNAREAARFALDGTLRSEADLRFHAGVVAPATAVRYTVELPNHRLDFSRDATAAAPAQPFSALGSLTFRARDIHQGGAVWAPFGQLHFEAGDTLAFQPGSLSSVASDSLLPYGRIENGKSWVYGAGSSATPVGGLPQKSIVARARAVDMQPGARVDLAGGGDLQAYEFTVGPGGSRDILADANTYAILPGFKGGFAPADAQEGFDRTSGEAVYLAGVPGLADGVYTLLPAHYALLPGAYAVKPGAGSVLPGQAYTRQDGIRVAAGYVTDTRAGAPRAGDWQGIQVLTRDQVRARSEFTLTRASDFFAGGFNLPQDAGVLSVASTGSGAGALKLDAIYNFAPAAGGRGAGVDISASKLAVVSGAPSGIDPDAVQLDAGRLNAMGASSLFIGGTRTRTGTTTTLDVGADAVTLANDAATPLSAGEVMLAARDTLTLKAGSAIDAQGVAGDAGQIGTPGNGAFVRAASTTAGFARSGTPDRSAGTLVGDAGSVVTAASSIVLDATRDNAFAGETRFRKNGAPVAGNLAAGATRVSFGAAPAGTTGLTYTQAEIDALDLAGLTLTSYSTFDFYGDARVGALDANGKPVLQNLTLQGAGLAGIDNTGQTAQLNARNLTLANPNNAAGFAAGGLLGSGRLAITADTLALGAGDKAVRGFAAVSATANELVGQGKGSLAVDAPFELNVARIRGEARADQSIDANGAFAVAARTADRTLAPVTALGAKWALKGTQIDFDSRAELPSGTLKLSATGGDVNLGANARADVAGRAVRFFDVEKPSWGGTVELGSDTGNVNVAAGARVDVSAAAGGDAGTLRVRAVNGSFNAAAGTLAGQAPANTAGKRGEGARADIDVGTLAGFSALNSVLENGGFDFERVLRVRSGNVDVAAGDTVRAQTLRIAADSGDIRVAGTLDASGDSGGRIALHAGQNLDLLAGGTLLARAGAAGKAGGTVELGSRDGTLGLAAGSSVDVSGGAGGQGGTLHLRARRVGNDVAVGALDAAVTGADAVNLEAVQTYSGIATLNDTGASSGSTLSLDTISADNTAWAAHHGAIKSRLGVAADPRVHLLSGVEVRAPGNLTLAADWNLKDGRAGGEPGVLTLRAQGNLAINNNLSDGFSHATPTSSGVVPATLLSGDSWSYRLVAGADASAADPLATGAGGDLTLAAGKLVRTGTGSIRAAAGGNISFASNQSVLYTAGRLTPPAPGFTLPTGPSGAVNYAQFSRDGGEIELRARGDIGGANRSNQFYSNWLFRQGRLNANAEDYDVQPAWWVRHDLFRQGVAALGGGNVSVRAGGQVRNLSVSAPTQAYTTGASVSSSALVKTGGGTVRVEAGGDVLGGQFFADNGDLLLRAEGKLGSGQTVGGKPFYPVLALADSSARVRAGDDASVQALVNPQLIVQASRTPGGESVNNVASTGPGGSSPQTLLWSVFSTFTERSGLEFESLAGHARVLPNVGNTSAENGSLQTAYSANNLLNFGVSMLNYIADHALLTLPPSLYLTAYQGDAEVGGSSRLVLSPAARAQLELLASDHVRIDQQLVLSDARANPDARRPATRTVSLNDAALSTEPARSHAGTPVHAGDPVPARIYARTGDVSGRNNQLTLFLAKALHVRAGRDVLDLGLMNQHADANNAVSVIEAGRDMAFSATGSDRAKGSYVWIGGPGRLEVTAGRTIDLGVSGGIVSRGNLDNPALPDSGASIHLAAGVGPQGVDYTGAVDRLLARVSGGNPTSTDLWLARWLAGDDTLTPGGAQAAVAAIDAADKETQRERVRSMLFTALRTSGRDANRADSGFAGDFARGYAALELLFPGIEAKNPGGSFANYQGDINLFASRVLTERGGNIDFIVPGGQVVVGLANTPESLTTTETPGSGIGLRDAGVLGIASIAAGDVRGAARGNMLVNQSRILTVGGGDVLLWSSEGDIDAGKGKKSASVVPPPLTLIDANGNVTQVLQGAASGSGIAALQPAGGTASDVDLIAPKGTVNAGDAGIRAGNLNIAAQVVLGADNISVSGTSTGTPVADTSAITATSSGATNAGGDVSSATAALAGNLAEAARAAEELKKAFKPTFISAEVIGYGE